MASTLYICYFGVREPLVQTQVIPYLVEIMKTEGEPGGRGVGELKVSLLTFEPAIEKGSEGKGKTGRKKERDAEFAAIRERLAEQGIDWHWLPYHKRPSALATAYDVFRGALFIRRMIGREQIDVLHGRVHIPTLMGALARKLSRRKPKLLFDIRGFFPEEYTDAGIWPEGGWLYRSAKRVERWLMKDADGFVVLTEKAREILFPDAEAQPDGGWETRTTTIGNNPQSAIRNRKSRGRPVEVIPCCVDFESRFNEAADPTREIARRELGVDGRCVIVHSGALGGLYLTNEIVDLLSAAKHRDPKTFALILTQSDQTPIRKLLAERGFSEADYIVKKVAPSEMPWYLSASDVAVSFVKSSFSTLSRSPTKIPEYLACGLPIIANRGVGDVDELIAANKVGVLIDDFSESGLNYALDELGVLNKDDQLPVDCRIVAKRNFDLQNVGGKRYRRIYDKLLTGKE